MKGGYEDPLNWIPDCYKKSALDIYEERKKEKAKVEARNNEPIPIVNFKDDSESTLFLSDVNDFSRNNNEQIESLQVFMKQQLHKQQYQE